MARKPPKLKVQFSRRSKTSLDVIWDWNADNYDAEHADKYIAFLEKHANGLATSYQDGRAVPADPDLRYVIVRRNQKGHGHVIVYKIVEDTYVNVVNFYHTSEDWQGKLARGEW